LKTYNVIIEEPAQRDLIGIFDYIAYTLTEPKVAERLVKRVRKSIESLSCMPKRFAIYDNDFCQLHGIRRMNVGNYAVFYKIESQIVSILTVLYGGRDMDAILELTLEV